MAAYREAVRRYQSNEDAKAVMVALASDADSRSFGRITFASSA
ncbi:hypothetical protein R3J27_08280 [Xylella fastidiosa subsp. multiplex]